MTSRLRRHALLAAIIVLATFMRLWALGEWPHGLDADEVSIGYNAYSVLHTGADEYGERWPAAFRAFGEYKRPLPIYATVPAIALFGLNPTAVRLPAALIGVASVPLLYALVLCLLRVRVLALWASLFLAVSPWHIQFTRGAREASFLFFATLWLALALFAALRSPPVRSGIWLCAAAVALLTGVYSYPSGVVFLPLLAGVVLLTRRRRTARLLQAIPRIWAAAAAGVLLVGFIPLGVQFADGRAGARYAAVSIWSNPGVVADSEQRTVRDRAHGAPDVLQHPFVIATRRAADAYVSQFNPSYLFTSGDQEPRHHVSDHGNFYLWDLPSILAGLVVVSRRLRWAPARVILGWLAVGAIPGSLTVQSPHAVRSLVMLPAWEMLAAVGTIPLWRWMSRRQLHWDWLALLGLSAVFYLYMAIGHYRYEHAGSFSSGWLETFALADAEVRAGGSDSVYIPSDLPAPKDAYIYALFATAYDPAAYLAQGGSRANPSSPYYPSAGPMHFVPFEVRPEKMAAFAEQPAPRTLYVYSADAPLPPGARVVRDMRALSGRVTLRLVDFPSAI